MYRLLDYDHVLRELELYSPFLSKGLYIVATDGYQEYLNTTTRVKIDYPECDTWGANNPKKAVEDFVRKIVNLKLLSQNFCLTREVLILGLPIGHLPLFEEFNYFFYIHI